MLFTNGRWELIGITSYGSGCGSADFPGVYTRVTSYRNWISCFLRNDTSCIQSTSSMLQSSSSSTSSLITRNIFCVIIGSLTILRCIHD